ncbi:hypothetical protein BU14_0431s0011 [Porphyra umbilicalis]|uniref:Uncharacterized protein n=1 Tax=Porphyra umbilicalis TaxID=2786 RepID=A0A1X6NV80_PORUM|nr:hypothetical protein BU14_0431s0011 [Porphyra umbilicalis]|eukprot:OSX72487.1 hypothetical protein BU14_0431s0011 [Porphyra umbilicalis]
MSTRRVQPPSPQPPLAAAARLHLRCPPTPALPPSLGLRRLPGDVNTAPTPPLTRRRRLQPPASPAECRCLVSTPPPGISFRPLAGCGRCQAAAAGTALTPPGPGCCCCRLASAASDWWCSFSQASRLPPMVVGGGSSRWRTAGGGGGDISRVT